MTEQVIGRQAEPDTSPTTLAEELALRVPAEVLPLVTAALDKRAARLAAEKAEAEQRRNEAWVSLLAVAIGSLPEVLRGYVSPTMPEDWTGYEIRHFCRVSIPGLCPIEFHVARSMNNEWQRPSSDCMVVIREEQSRGNQTAPNLDEALALAATLVSEYEAADPEDQDIPF